jgi:hypothetical protein
MNAHETVDLEFWLNQWLLSYRIDARLSDCDRWRAVAYDAEGGVLEFASGDSRRLAIETLCVEIGVISFWEIPPCPKCGIRNSHSADGDICS